MKNLWLRIRVGIKLTLLAVLAFYVISFILENNGKHIQVWVWFKTVPDSGLLTTLFCTFVAGIIFTILVRAIWHTGRQIAEARQRSRTDRLEREMADIKNKAAKLQTRPQPQDTPG